MNAHDPRLDPVAVTFADPCRQPQPVGACAMRLGIGHRREVDADHDVMGVDFLAHLSVRQRAGIADKGDRLATQRRQKVGLRDRQGRQQPLIAHQPRGDETQGRHVSSFR